MGCASSISASNGATSASDSALVLTDTTVSLSPYFEVKDLKKFKDIWKAAYDPFPHKEDAVHYAFTFTKDNVAHCREAYKDAAGVLQHLKDVDTPLKAVLDPDIASLLRLEVHGPKAEIGKLIEPLTPFGTKFFVTDWGFRPSRPPQENDTVVHLYPYFDMKDESKFKQIWFDAFPATKAAAESEKSAMYAFAFDKETALCREAYGDAEGVLLHLQNVDAPLKAVLDPSVASLLRLEVHGPKGELDKLQGALGPLGAQFFELEWGFRNAT